MSNLERKSYDALDRLTTNPWTAFPIFILIVYFLFWCTFSLGSYPMDWIQSAVNQLSGWLNSVLHPEWLRDLMVDGILAGIGGVLMFLPNIIILYILISIMESTGYMGRVAFIMDRIMHKMGLHGKSFIPMIMGFGCNVPAIMACKDLKPKKSRLITAFVIPFMSCSGRLPVYLLFVAAFFPDNGALVLLGIYALSVLVAFAAARTLSSLIPGISGHDHVKIKPYSAPDLRYVLRNSWDQCREYMKKLAGPILVFSVALWVLGYFPHAEEGVTPYEQKEQSFVGRIGHAIDPVLEPIGLNWRDGVALIAGVGAKELIVSTLGVMYSDGSDALQPALAHHHTSAGALAFILFVLLYCPCIGTFAAIKHVTGKWRWTIGSAVFGIAVAWIVAFAAFHLL